MDLSDVTFHKTDNEGKNFIGWSEKYDEWKPAECPTIQRLGSMHKFYHTCYKATMHYDDVVQHDIYDPIYNSKQVHHWGTYRYNQFNGSGFMHNIINNFGRLGGFEKIQNKLREMVKDNTAEAKFDNDLVYQYIKFVSRTAFNWNRQFAFQYLQSIFIDF
jgi:hypothetical protein